MPTHRFAEQKDLPAIVRIYNSTIASRQVTADLEEISVASRQQWFDEHTPNRRPLWVIEAESEGGASVVGWMSFSDFKSRAAYDGTVEVSVYLDPHFRGQGIGSYCLNLAEIYSPQIGVNTLLGYIFGHNTPSLRLFERFQYQQWAVMPNIAILDGIERDLIIVGKRLV
ncbi:L-amino acid N-acyltransferase YncA [Oxalobacteraceae bacterium GrIS 2.11]